MLLLLNIINILRYLNDNNIKKVEAWFFSGMPNISTM
jgi:hypothetical protein